MTPHPSRATGSQRHRLARWALAAATLGGFAAFAVATPSPAGASSRVTVKLVNHGSLGKILVNGNGMTVYIFTADSANKPTCTGGCATAWPPVTVAKGTKPKGGLGVSHLGTVSVGGTLQVTWNKHPLYTYALDNSPGDVKGNGIQVGSGTWYAATAKKVSPASATAPTRSGGTGGAGGYGY